MATLIKEPGLLEVATGHQIWSLDDIGVGEKFVLQIEADGNIIATQKQTPNAAGVAHFDIQDVLRKLFDPINIETTVQATGVPGSAIRYRVRYGIEAAGQIIFEDFSDFKVVLNGYKKPNELDWAEADRFLSATEVVQCLGGQTLRFIEGTSFLTNSPVTELRDTDWYTLSLMNFHRPPLTQNINATPWAVQILLFEGNSLLDEVLYTLKSPLIGPRVDCTDTTLPLLSKDQVVHVGCGPQNLRLLNPSVDVDNTTRYVVNIRSYDSCVAGAPADCDEPDDIRPYLGPIWATREFTIANPCTKFVPIQMSFLNKYGVLDYYTFIRRNERSDRITRTDYLQEPGTWNSATFAVNPQMRGYKVNSSSIISDVEMSTDWIEDETSLWLRELFLSPDIRIYYEGQWIPVVSLTQEYEEKTHARNNKLYRYNIRVKLANNIRVQS